MVLLSHYNFTTKLRFYYHKTIFTITLRFYYHIMILLLRNKFTTMYNVSLLYLSYNMGKVPRKLIKLQCYLIFQPIEAVILARKKKQCAKSFLYYTILEIYQTIGNIYITKFWIYPMNLLSGHLWQWWRSIVGNLIYVEDIPCSSLIKNIFELIYHQEQLFTGVWNNTCAGVLVLLKFQV